MKPSLSFSRLPSSLKRVNDVPLVSDDSLLLKGDNQKASSSSPSLSSSNSSIPLSSNLDDYLSNPNGSRILNLNKRSEVPYSPPFSTSSSTINTFTLPRIGGRNGSSSLPQVKNDLALPRLKQENSSSQRLSKMIDSAVKKSVPTPKKIVENAKKKSSTSSLNSEQQQRKALKHTSIDLEDDTSADEEEFSSENEEDRAFIDDEMESSDDAEEESEEGSEGESEEWEEVASSGDSDPEEEASIILECQSEDDEDSDGGPEAKVISLEDEAVLRQAIEERKYLSPIDMTYVPGLSEGGYGANTLKNLAVMLLNSAMDKYYTYTEMPVSRVQAILTATAEYNNRVPISRGSTEGTVMAYRLWLYTRERVRKAALKTYDVFPEMVDFLESLNSPSLMDSFFLVKKDFPVETCFITGNPTDVGFEIVSGLNQQETSTLWFDRTNEDITDIFLNFLRFWFLPFTLRSFVKCYIKSMWTLDEDASSHEIKRFFTKHLQPLVYENIKTLVESFVSMMRFFGLRVNENSELSYS